MITITQIRIELQPEAILPCSIETEESLDSYRKRIQDDLERYNIKSTVEFIYKESSDNNQK
jgi:hypothetical protein